MELMGQKERTLSDTEGRIDLGVKRRTDWDQSTLYEILREVVNNF